MLQCLFAADISGNPNKSSLDWLNEEDPLPDKGVAFARP